MSGALALIITKIVSGLNHATEPPIKRVALKFSPSHARGAITAHAAPATVEALRRAQRPARKQRPNTNKTTK